MREKQRKLDILNFLLLQMVGADMSVCPRRCGGSPRIGQAESEH